MLLNMFEHSSWGFCIVHLELDANHQPIDWTYLYCNDYFAKLENTPKEELKGQRFYDLFPNAERKYLATFYRAAYGKKVIEYDEIFEKLGHYFHVSCIPLDKEGVFACVLQDIKQNELEKAQINSELEEALRKLRQENELLEMLSRDYVTIYKIDVIHDRFTTLKMTPETFPDLLRKEHDQLPESFSEFTKLYAQRFVVSSQREEFIDWFSMAHFKKILKDTDRASYRYATFPGREGMRYFDAQVIRFNHDAEQFEVIASFRRIDEVVALEQKRQEMLHEALHEAKLRNEVISTIGKIYVSIYHIDLMRDSLEELSTTDEAHTLTGNTGIASQRIKEFIAAMIQEDYQAEAKKFLCLDTLDQRLAKEETVSMELLCKDGNWYLARFIVKRRDETGKVTHVLYVTRLISETKRKEESLIREVQAANRANAEKSAFLSRLSHDIRTPLNALQGYMTLAEKQIDNPEHMQKCLDKSKQAGKYLESLVNDVLSLTQIEHGVLTIREEPCDLRKFMYECAEIVQMANADHKVEIKYNIHDLPYPVVKTDRLHRRQIFCNLISNAFRYTGKDGVVELEVYEEVRPEDQGKVLVHSIVRDNGIGMSPEFMKVMYSRFSRAVDTRVNKVRGNGLGLAVVKELVDGMGGTIEVKSELNKGTEFTVSFLLEPVQSEPSQVQKETKIQPYHLLVAEDNDLNYEVEEEIMHMYDITCQRAEDGKECLEMFQKNQNYDAILMDIQMPVMNGWEAAKAIRSLDLAKAKTIPIIAVTANSFQRDIQASKDAGMDAHISKPFNVQELLKILQAKIQKEAD